MTSFAHLEMSFYNKCKAWGYSGIVFSNKKGKLSGNLFPGRTLEPCEKILKIDPKCLTRPQGTVQPAWEEGSYSGYNPAGGNIQS